MKKRKTLLALLTIVLAIVTFIAAMPSVMAKSYVTDADWIDEPKALVKCNGGTCDHTSCDYVYSFAVVGDTQNINLLDAKNYASAKKTNPSLTYDEYESSYMKTLYNWILNNKEEKNIQYVMGVGDITATYKTSGEHYANEWALAQSAISLLDGKLGYSLVRGNHDISSGFNGKFGQGNTYYSDLVALSQTKDSSGRPMAGIRTPDKIEDTYRKVIIGSDKYIIFTLDHYPTEECVAWLNSLLTENSDYKAIITLHAFLTKDASFCDDVETTTPAEDSVNNNWKETATGGNVSPRELWETSLSLHKNVSMVIAGHVDIDDIVVSQLKGNNGNTVTCMLIDGQTIDTEYAPVGLVTIFYVSADGKVVNVEHISSIRDTAGDKAYLKDKNQFEICIDYGDKWTDTKYGSLPTEQYDSNIFHVFLDDDGDPGNISSHFGSYNSWRDTMSAIQAFNGISGIESRKLKHYNILMSKDYTYSDGIAPNQIGSNPGVITLDVNGKTLTVDGNGVLVPLYNRNNTFSPTFVLKSGNVITANGGKIAVLQTSTAKESAPSNLILEDLDISYNSSKASVVSMYGGSVGGNANVNLTVKNCDIDITGTGSAITVFDLKDEHSNNDATLTIIGGSIKGKNAANTKIFNINPDDTVVFDKNESGKYIKLILNEKSDISTVYTGVNGEDLTFSTDSASAPYVYSFPGEEEPETPTPPSEGDDNTSGSDDLNIPSDNSQNVPTAPEESDDSGAVIIIIASVSVVIIGALIAVFTVIKKKRP